jgi:hypothetical protein
VAGPLIREPSAIAKVEWCAGHVLIPFAGGPTRTPRCGQLASKALNVPLAGCTMSTRATTMPPPTGTSFVAANTVPLLATALAAVAGALPGEAGSARALSQAPSTPQTPAPSSTTRRLGRPVTSLISCEPDLIGPAYIYIRR